MTFQLATASLDHSLDHSDKAVIKACRSKSKRHKFQALVPKLVQFTTILLIFGFGTIKNIFSTTLGQCLSFSGMYVNSLIVGQTSQMVGQH